MADPQEVPYLQAQLATVQRMLAETIAQADLLGAVSLVDRERELSAALIRALQAENERYAEALEDIVRSLGPAAPSADHVRCEGCLYEWNAALETARAALRDSEQEGRG